MATSACEPSRPRRPQATLLYRPFESCVDDSRSEWEERFEGRCGHWRGSIGSPVGVHFDCSILDNDFTRVRCGACPAELLVLFSCEGRRLWPSRATKRATALAASLREREALLEAFRRAGGNRDEAARLTEVSVRTLDYGLRRFGIS